jgi:phospholipid/cholesterol/gamma-HCH transport system substrate-binding protein
MSLLAQDERLTRRVGAVTLVLVVLASVFFVIVYDRIEWGPRMRVHVHLASSGGLVEGASFVVAGRAIGKVESIALSPRGRSALLDGEEGVVVTVALDASRARRVNRSGDVFVTSRGALSTRYLEIGPPLDPAAPALADGDELRGRDPPSLDRVLQRTWTNLTTAARFVSEVRPELDALLAEVDALQVTLVGIAPELALRDEIAGLVAESKRTYTALGGEPGVDRMGALVRDTRSTIAQAREMIGRLRASADALSASAAVLRRRIDTRGVDVFDRIEAAIARARAAADKVEPLLAQVELLQAHLARGDGSLLKLMRDPEFPEDAKELGRILKRQPWKILDRPIR